MLFLIREITISIHEKKEATGRLFSKLFPSVAVNFFPEIWGRKVFERGQILHTRCSCIMELYCEYQQYRYNILLKNPLLFLCCFPSTWFGFCSPSDECCTDLYLVKNLIVNPEHNCSISFYIFLTMNS